MKHGVLGFWGFGVLGPVSCLLLMGVTMFAWHTPRLYELALASSSWHEVEHAGFLLASLVFWWPVFSALAQPHSLAALGSRALLAGGDPRTPRVRDPQVFSDRLLYPSYAAVPRLFGFPALHDQAAAGAIMWVIGSLAFVIPAIAIAVQCLQSNRWPAQASSARKPEPPSRDGLLAWWQPLAFPGRFLRGRLSGRRFEAISFVLLFAVAGLCLARLASSSSGDDDDQVLRLSQQSGPYAVSVFAPAGDLKTGQSDFSVLVQDRDSQEVLRDAAVALRAQQVGNPLKAQWTRATSEDSENKLLQSATVNLPDSGDWVLDVEIQHGGRQADFSLPVRVVKPASGMSFPWPYILLLGF